jgi:hypothetical protein
LLSRKKKIFQNECCTVRKLVDRERSLEVESIETGTNKGARIFKYRLFFLDPLVKLEK